MNILQPILSLIILLAITHCVKQIAQKLTIPTPLIALITGFLLTEVYRIMPIQLPSDFFSTLVLILFILLVFESTARLKLSATDTTAAHSLAFIVLFASLIFVGLSLTAKPFLNITPISSVILAAALLGVSAELLPNIKTLPHSEALIRLEAFWTTPISLIVPIVIAMLIPPVTTIFVSDTINFFLFTTIKFIASIATGVFVGILFAKLLTHTKTAFVPPLIIATAFIAFALGTLWGHGILATAAFGLFFTNAFATTHKPFVQLNHKLTNYAGILAVILLGSTARLQLTPNFITLSAALFSSYIVIRYVAIRISHKKHAFSKTENKLMTFYAPASEAQCALFLFLATFPPTSIPLAELKPIISIGIMFVLYSNILAFAIIQAPQILKVRK
ncbi:hypothetical protein HY485_03735 [Candidatus Woesearchaeota archaeon]|nr:hypothetical protein [Candidatus Woesearchaeota archaeon]